MGGFWVVAGRPSRCRLLVVSVAVLAMVSSLGAVSSAQAAVVKSILAGAVAAPVVTRIQPLSQPSRSSCQAIGWRR